MDKATALSELKRYPPESILTLMKLQEPSVAFAVASVIGELTDEQQQDLALSFWMKHWRILSAVLNGEASAWDDVEHGMSPGVIFVSWWSQMFTPMMELGLLRGVLNRADVEALAKQLR